MTERTSDINDLKLYSLTELEEIIGVTHRTLLSYVKTGKLKAVKVGSKWRVSRADLVSFIGA